MKNNIEASIEAILFANGEPLEGTKISQVLGLSQKELEVSLNLLSQQLNSSTSGIKLIKLNDKYQLCSKSQYAEYIRDVMNLRKNTPLTPAAMEVLSIVAYNEPVTKSFIEQIRGVDCSYLVGSLCSKRLLEERGRLELPGRPLIYGTTSNFLRCFGLQSLDDLPAPPTKDKSESEKDDINCNEVDNTVSNKH